MNMYRHGDLLIVRMGDCPESVSHRMRRMVLAEGEITGHAHVIAAPGRLTGDRLILPEGGTISHDEHRSIVLEPGDYRVIHQQQFTPITSRWARVRD
jgi:hypothetical protein